MSSHARTNLYYKSKNPRGQDEDSGGVDLTICNPSRPQSSKRISAPVRQSRKPSLSSDRNELQEPTLQKTPMKLFIQPDKERYDEYENEADDDFCSSPQQPFQPTHYSLEENLLNEDGDTSTSDYQLDHKPSRRPISLKEKQIVLEMLKEKIRNLELRHAMNRANIFSSPKNHLYLRDLDQSSGLKRTWSIIAQTMQTSVLFAIRSKVVPKAGPQTKSTKKLSGYLLLMKKISGTITG